MGTKITEKQVYNFSCRSKGTGCKNSATILSGKFGLMKIHREIGAAIFGPSSPVGVPFEIGEPAIPEVVKEALEFWHPVWVVEFLTIVTQCWSFTTAQ